METKYPNFSNGEVLTADKLNEMVKYLDGQTKLSRINLFGYGIVDNLSYKCEQTSNSVTLTIYPGIAITPNGSSIVIKGCHDYTLYKQEKGNYIFLKEKLDGYNKETAINLSDYVFAIEIYEEKESLKCNQKSCDVNHSDVIQKIRPILIEKKKVSKSCHYLNHIQIDLNLNKLTNIHTSLNYYTLIKQQYSVFEKNQTVIVNALKCLLEPLDLVFVSTKIPYILEPSKSEFTFDSVIPDWKSKANRFLNVINKISKLNKRGKGCIVVPPYYLSFLEDMKKAIIEFVEFYNEFAEKYQRSFRNHSPYADRTIVLGESLVFDEQIPDLNKHDTYREFYQDKKPNKQYKAECKIIDKLFTRILCMSESFIMERYDRKSDTKTVQIIPISLSRKLGDKIIPFYYQLDKGIVDCWQAHKLTDIDRTAINSYEDFMNCSSQNNLYNYTTDNLMTYSLQGGYYKNTQDVQKAAMKIINEYNLPLEIEIITIPNLRLSKNHYDKLNSYMSSAILKSVTKFDIKTHKDYKKTSRFEKEKYQKDKDSTMDTKNYVEKILKTENLADFVNAIYNNEPLPKNGLNELYSSISAISPHKLKLFYKYAFNSKIENRFASLKKNVPRYKGYFWKIEPVAAITQIKDIITRTSFPEYKYAELEPVSKFSKIILVSYNSKLVMDFFVPMKKMF